MTLEIVENDESRINAQRSRDSQDARRTRRARIKELNASPNRPRCAYCGELLSVDRYFDTEFGIARGRKWGYDGEGVFCTLRCGYEFAKLAVEAGFVAKR